MKGRFTAVLFVIVFILIAAAVFTVLSGLDRSKPAEPTPPAGGEEVVIVTAEPVSTPFVAPAATSEPAPAQTLVPVPTQSPAAAPTPVPVTPVPTLEPTPVPASVPYAAPVQTTLASGSFSSQTGTWLNITADWSVTSLDQDRVTVTVSVSAVSFALHYTSFPRSLNISLDGQYVSLDPPTITYDGGEQAVHALGTTSFTVNLPANSSKALTLQVEWQFNGEMGGPNGRMQLPVIECGGPINVAR